MRGVEYDLADVVRRERLRRDWSVRKAASAGGISNTYWGGFEDYKQPLTPLIVKAVAAAFEWSTNWPVENAPDGEDSLSGESADSVRRVLLEQARQTEELRDHVEDLVTGILQRLEDVEAWIAAHRDGGRARPGR